ncbi:MAG: FKBP-type peptidyl-prolyl cis-trans isomerase [Pseudomonadales bacterium]
MTNKVIAPQSKVEMHFEIRLQDGAVVDSNFARKPVSFTLGDGNMLAGFEAVLLGLKAGDKQTFALAPEQGFGAHNPSNIQTMARSAFKEMELERGLVVSFQEPGGELPGVIADFDEQSVAVDFNHPLAGQTLVFQVEILAVEES